MADSVKELLKDWTKKTAGIFKSNQRKMQIGQSMELFHSMKDSTRQAREDMVVATFEFLLRGRFSDMGVGKGTKFGQRRDANRDSYNQKRQPKKWYSRTFYGRLNALQSAIGFTFMEKAISAIKDPLTLQAYEAKRGRKF